MDAEPIRSRTLSMFAQLTGFYPQLLSLSPKSLTSLPLCAMAKSNDDTIFTGLPGSDVDCDDLIRIVRRQALSEGKSGDDIWITQFLASCLTKAALRWYEGLDDEVQNNWRLLRRAMLERWPGDDETQPAPSVFLSPKAASSSEYLPQTSIAPTPAAAPLVSNAASAPSSLITGPRTGRIKVVMRNEGTDFGYISTKPDHVNDYIARDIHSAMIVQIVPVDSPHNIKIISDPAEDKWLSLIWETPNALEDELVNQNTRWAALTAAKLEKSYSSEPFRLCNDTTHSGPWRASIWNVLMDGTIVMTWQGNKGAHYMAHANIIVSTKEYGGVLFINSAGRQEVGTMDPYFADCDIRRARLVFEPI